MRATVRTDELTRRALLERMAIGGAAFAAVGQTAAARTASHQIAAARTAPRAPRPIPLPSPAQVRQDFTRMVRFGPRLTGSDGHNRYIAWLEQEFTAAGLELIPCDTYETDRWLPQRVELELLDGPAAGAVKVGAYYPRSRPTPAAGVSGPLVYGGAAPLPSVSGTDLAALQAALSSYPAELATWASGIVGTLAGGISGGVLLVDLPVPLPLVTAAFLPLTTYLNWPGHTLADWAVSDYKRLWLEPGLGLPLAPFQLLGAAAVVFILDSSYEAMAGGYLPFGHGPEPLPALYVDRDTGAQLRAQAITRPRARLTLTATRERVPASTVTAVLPGTSDETLIFSTHTDGQGFAEENGGVAFVQLARYFASLPRSARLKRTLVFAAWPGHMTYDLPQAQGWIDAHPDLVARAAAALTVEHLGCSEWIDTLDRGYHATGEAEMFAIWTTQGKMFELTRDTVIKHQIPHAALLRPPIQFGVGGPFQSAGVPQIGAIAGPEYLVTISPSGDLDKLDEALAARQIAWLADLATELDTVPAAELRQGDPTLGPGGGAGTSTKAIEQVCHPPTSTAGTDYLITASNLVVDYDGYQHAPRGVVLGVWTTHGAAHQVELRLLHHGHVVAQAHIHRVTTKPQRLVLRAARHHRLSSGRHTLVIRVAQRTRASRAVQVSLR